MALFIPVNYRNKVYPEGIVCSIQEIAGHLDKSSISPKGAYSLHTEYAYGKRKLSSSLILKYPTLQISHNNFVPQLWYNEQWAKEFALFLVDLVANHLQPEIIEIHPPFNDYCATVKEFFKRYKIFEETILSYFPNVKICIENRAGTIYRGGRFLISNAESIRELFDILSNEKSPLKLVLDYPQLFTAEHYNLDNFPLNKFLQTHETLDGFQKHIQGIHIWGKRKNAKGRWVAHFGDLNSLFLDNQENKKVFLQTINQFFDDSIARYFVPEVNSSPVHLHSIINDFKNVGFYFKQTR